MKRYSRIILTTLAAVLLFVAACAPRAEVAPVSTPEPTVSVTATPTAAPTPTPTAIPTPEMDEYGFTEERKAQLNQQFQDFLNKEGNYTAESLTGQLLTGQSNEIFYKGERKLGLMDTTPRIQCWLFDYFMWKGSLMLIAGLDDIKGERFVTLFEIPVYFYDQYEPATFTFTQLAGTSHNGHAKSVEPYCSSAQMMEYLDQLRDRPVITTLDLKKCPDDWLTQAQSVGEYAVKFVNECNSRVDVAKSLAASVFTNGIDLEIDDFNKASIFCISSISDLAEIDLSKTVILSVDFIFSLYNGSD